MKDTNKLRMSAKMAEKIRAHGTETYPEECCGALLGHDAREEGPPREILEVLRLLNRREESRRKRFSVTPKDVLGVEKEAAAHGLEVIGWYHSHPDHPARPSEYDRENAWPWYSYVIVSVQGGAAKEMTSWRLQDNRERYAEEAMEIADAPAPG